MPDGIEVKDIILTDEHKAKLKGLLAFDVSATFPYVPKAYRESDIPKELWPIFILKSKDGLELAQAEDDAGVMLYDQQTQQAKMKLCAGTMRVKTLKRGIKSWKNWRNEEGILIEYNKTKHTNGSNELSDSALRSFPIALQLELQNAINERSILTPEELQGLES